MCLAFCCQAFPVFNRKHVWGEERKRERDPSDAETLITIFLQQKCFSLCQKWAVNKIKLTGV